LAGCRYYFADRHPQAVEYGKCVVADYNSVHKDKCVKEFLKLKDCYLVRRDSVSVSNTTSVCVCVCVCVSFPIMADTDQAASKGSK
jgi:hypothetical protein